jgi:hypothetical protein
MPFQEDIVPQKAGAYAHDAAPTPPDYRRAVQIMTSVIKKSLVYIIIPLLIFMMLKSAFFLTESGYIYLYENTLTGQIHVYDEPGFHGKIPFFRV